jgi:tRNA A-37 threonylcarbamoyl transferase component Bud32
MSAKWCPQCQTELTADAPEGLCPACLLRGGLPSGAGGTAPYSRTFRPPEPAELAPFFPHLEILDLIGQGGMGAVYKARQVRLDRPVALKVLPPEEGRDPAFAERFLREARALARLNHPQIVTVHDFGEAGGYYYFLMEYVGGVDLRQALRAGRFTPAQALAIVPQLCDALQYAHDKGVVHRDIKPENVLLDEHGRIKIADFGLAKLLGRAPVDPSLTGTRQVLGTPHYMAPEQMERPATVDHRADIFSLGVLFYEMLTGELPLGRFPPPSQKVQIDVRLDEVVLRALEKEPARRYQKASDVRGEIEAITEKRRPAAVPPRPAAPAAPAPPVEPSPWSLVTFLACAVVVMASFMKWVTSYRTIQATAWNSSLRLGEMEFPNWLVAMAALGIAALTWLRQNGTKVPSFWVPTLALYGLAHTVAVGFLAGGDQTHPELAHFFTLGGMVAILMASAPPTAYAPARSLTAAERQAIRRRLRWPAAALMLVGIGAVLFWGGWLVIVGVIVIDARPRPPASAWPPSIAYLVSSAAAVLGIIITCGASHLSRLGSYRLAAATPWLALLPLGPLGWPAAVWGWWALSRPGVRAAFRSSAAYSP